MRPSTLLRAAAESATTASASTGTSGLCTLQISPQNVRSSSRAVMEASLYGRLDATDENASGAKLANADCFHSPSARRHTRHDALTGNGSGIALETGSDSSITHATWRPTRDDLFRWERLLGVDTRTGRAAGHGGQPRRRRRSSSSPASTVRNSDATMVSGPRPHRERSSHGDLVLQKEVCTTSSTRGAKKTRLTIVASRITGPSLVCIPRSWGFVDRAPGYGEWRGIQQAANDAFASYCSRSVSRRRDE